MMQTPKHKNTRIHTQKQQENSITNKSKGNNAANTKNTERETHILQIH